MLSSLLWRYTLINVHNMWLIEINIGFYNYFNNWQIWLPVHALVLETQLQYTYCIELLYMYVHLVDSMWCMTFI